MNVKVILPKGLMQKQFFFTFTVTLLWCYYFIKIMHKVVFHLIHSYPINRYGFWRAIEEQLLFVRTFQEVPSLNVLSPKCKQTITFSDQGELKWARHNDQNEGDVALLAAILHREATTLFFSYCLSWEKLYFDLERSQTLFSLQGWPSHTMGGI